jgi:hypothetical protein
MIHRLLCSWEKLHKTNRQTPEIVKHGPDKKKEMGPTRVAKKHMCTIQLTSIAWQNYGFSAGHSHNPEEID